jgi:creatinine amidohydrolase
MRWRSRYWADHAAREIAALGPERLVAVLPVGAIEQHGPHLPLSTDQTIVDGVVKAALAHLPEECPALILPTCAIGKSDEHAQFPGTLTFSAATLTAMWTEIGESVARSGVRKFVMLNSHGGQIAIMDVVARELRIRRGMIAVAANWFAMGLPEGLLSDAEERFGIHGGDLETSIMLALAPQFVDMSRSADFSCAARSWAEDGYEMLGLTGAGKLGWRAQDMNPAGACGDASAATVEKGRAFLDHAGRRVARLLQEVARAPLSWIENVPDLERRG